MHNTTRHLKVHIVYACCAHHNQTPLIITQPEAASISVWPLEVRLSDLSLSEGHTFKSRFG